MDQQQIKSLLDGLPPVEFSMDPANAFALVALLQLAMRHPALTDSLAEVGLEVVDGIRRGMPPAIQQQIDIGFHPDTETLVTGDPA